MFYQKTGKKRTAEMVRETGRKLLGVASDQK